MQSVVQNSERKSFKPSSHDNAEGGGPGENEVAHLPALVILQIPQSYTLALLLLKQGLSGLNCSLT
jgi:hypothetical protein